MSIILLKCATCGGPLQITDDIDRFTCRHCKSDQIVIRQGGVVIRSEVVDKIRQGVDRTASELAIRRIEGELSGYELELSGLRNDRSCLAELLALLFFILVIIFAFSSGEPYSLFLILAAVLALGVAVVINTKHNKLVEAKRDSINSIISKKKRELQKHLELVERC